MKKWVSILLALLLFFNITTSSVAEAASMDVNLEYSLSSSRTIRSRSSHRIKSSSRSTFKTKRRSKTTSSAKPKTSTKSYRPGFGYYMGRTIHSVFTWYFWGPIIKIALIIVLVIVILYFIRRIFIH